MKKIITLSLIFLGCSILAQDSTFTHKVLINDPQLQYEITEGMNMLYNFQFDKCDSIFKIFKNIYPEHPLPYFLLGYSMFWRIQPNEEVRIYDDKFYEYMDTVITLADRMYRRNEKDYEAIFFRCAAYAFKGRLYSDRESWAKATLSGKNALDNLKLSREYNTLSPEFLFGEGMYNYFAEWIPENFKGLRPVMWFFPNGDKKKGMEQLKAATENAFYTRIEAQHYYIKMLIFEENKHKEALPLAKMLHEMYPHNPVFHRLYARILYSMGIYSECITQCNQIINRIDSNMTGYEQNTGRYATFFMGWYYRNTDIEKAKYYFKKCIAYSESIGAHKLNFYLYSLAEMGKIAEKEKKKDTAALYYEKIKKYATRKHSTYREARKYLSEND
ncbi:MAG: tetratricopeptide repeat protein [Cytophagales bacterium]|nr:tetratricopeptide repeat protein [Cytophagales bacterium]